MVLNHIHLILGNVIHNLSKKTSTALFAAQVNNGAVIQIWKIAFMMSSVTPQDDVLAKHSASHFAE